MYYPATSGAAKVNTTERVSNAKKTIEVLLIYDIQIKLIIRCFIVCVTAKKPIEIFALRSMHTYPAEPR